MSSLTQGLNTRNGMVSHGLNERRLGASIKAEEYIGVAAVIAYEGRSATIAYEGRAVTVGYEGEVDE